LDERELTLVNLCVDKADIWAKAPDDRERSYQNAQAFLHAAEVLGARTVRINSAVDGKVFTDEQFDWVVKRFKEYAQRAYDHGYKVGPENHWGAENVPENMQRICQAVDHPGFGMLLHFKGIKGDTLMAPWAMHTHISWDTTMNSLGDSVTMLRNTGYQGCWGVEHHSGKNEYARVAVQLAMLRKTLSGG
jgi:sugar phosphate isomerase/epimerase